MFQDDEHGIPNFRNMGVLLRILVLAEGVYLITRFAYREGGLFDLALGGPGGFLFELSLICVLAMLFLCGPALRRLTHVTGFWAVVTIVASTTVIVGVLVVRFLPEVAPDIHYWRRGFVAALMSVGILWFFDWRQRVRSPALTDARIAALQARIRPHFLFNSLNTAISAVRQDARLAEKVLLDLSDLFRVVLSEPRSLVPLGDEIRVARSYLDIEYLRLGGRLNVNWNVANAPESAMVPVLLIQPLVENAVWHGVEPLEQGGTVTVSVETKGKLLQIEVTNPVPEHTHSRPGGHRMALNNIRERLALHFDEEARLRASEEAGLFRVQVEMPVRLEND
ncbi:sensor histidine kinase [Rhodocyclaceae bacterium SMB388]